MANKKILLVDDEKDFLELMNLRLTQAGYDIIKAYNGQEAVDAVLSKGPDIIILDYMMPDMDGVTTLREIRTLNKKVPVIMFTAYPETQAMKDTEKLGISAFIPKLSTYADTFSLLKSAIDLIEKNLHKKGN